MNGKIMTAQYAENPKFLKSLEWLIDLQHAICKQDEEEADRLRDRMEAEWYSLSRDEKKLFQNVSCDLESICDQEIFEPNPYSEAEYRNLVDSAVRNWQSSPEVLLGLLRMQQSVFPKHAILFARGSAYSRLGLFAVSLEFHRFAEAIAPAGALSKIFILEDLIHLGRHDEAWNLANVIFDDLSSTPLDLINSAGFVFLSHYCPPSSNIRIFYGRLRRVIQGVFDKTPPEELGPIAGVYALLTLGGILEALNRKSDAKGAYIRATQISPNDDIPWVALGTLLFSSDESEALDCFKRAVRLDSILPLPYVALAEDALNQESYEECKILCSKVLDIIDAAEGLPTDTSLAASVYGLLSLAEMLTNGNSDTAVKWINEALRLNPSNERLQSQRQAMLLHESRFLLSPQPPNRSQWLEDIQRVPLNYQNKYTETMQQDLRIAA